MKVNPKVVFLGLIATLTITQAHAMRWYSPSTGKWFSRDPIGEAGGQNLFAMLNNDPVNKLDLLGLAAAKASEKKKCKCCCAENLSIEDIKKTDHTPNYGHAFHVKIKLSFKPADADGDCKLTWWEKSNRMPLVPPEVNDKWNNLSELLKDYHTALDDWDNRKPDQTDITLTDNPEANANLPKRVLLIEIVLDSAPGCPCKYKQKIVTATQTIAGGGKLTTQDFKLGLPPGEPK